MGKVENVGADSAPRGVERRVSRRAFLRAAASGLGALAVGSGLHWAHPIAKAIAAGQSGSPVGGRPGGASFLFLDVRNIAETNNVVQVLGKVEKHPANPLFGPDRPWEGNYDNFYGNVVFDARLGEFKVWYLNKDARVSDLLYARSSDGIHWEKPSLGLVDYRGSRTNNIVLRGAHGAGVFLDERERDPGKRYKMLSKHERPEYLQVAHSSDGIHWSPQIPQPAISATADTHNVVLWAPTLGRYVAFTRQWSLWPYNDQSFKPPDEMIPERHRLFPRGHELRRKGVRQVARTQTASPDDFASFERAEVVLEGTDFTHQAYSMPVFYYEGVYLGLVAIYEDFLSHRVFTELAWSADTISWHRICPGVPLIPNGGTGEYDHGMVWACASPIPWRNDEILIYYGGFDLPHGADGRVGSMCLARIKQGRWAGYMAGGSVGTILTAPIRWQGGALWVNADASGGRVTAEALDRSGRVIDGLSAAECKPIDGDHIKARVVWTGTRDLTKLSGQEIRIRWRLQDATLFAYGVDHP